MHKIDDSKNVVVANDIIQRGKFSLSAKELKIIFYIIAQIKRDDEEFRDYEFDVNAFCRTCDIKVGGMQWKELENALIRLEQPWIIRNGKISYSLAWTRGYYLDPDSNKLFVSLDKRLKPYLLQLKEHFTQWELSYTLHFKSKYTIRLYILAKSVHYYENKEYVQEYKVDDIKSLLDAQDYKEYRDFKRRVLETAVNEINKFSDKIVSYEPIKNGRTVAYIRLKIATKSAVEIKKLCENNETKSIAKLKPELKQEDKGYELEISKIFKNVFGRESDDAFKKIISRMISDTGLTLDNIGQVIEFSGRMKPNVPEAYIITMLRGSGVSMTNQKAATQQNKDRMKELTSQEFEIRQSIIEERRREKIIGKCDYEKIVEYEKMLEDIEREIRDLKMKELAEN